MLKWSDTPPPASQGYGMRLLRTPPKGRLKGLVTSEKLHGTPTHYYGGHTVPCLREDCKACTAGVGWLWHGYLSLITPDVHEHILLELTAQACEQVKNWIKANGKLRGTLLIAERAGTKANGRVMLKLSLCDMTTIVLPPDPDVPKYLMHIWGITDGHTVENTYAEDRGPGMRIERLKGNNGHAPKEFAPSSGV